jgi:very-short-patch-repair endonuclease
MQISIEDNDYQRLLSFADTAQKTPEQVLHDLISGLKVVSLNKSATWKPPVTHSENQVKAGLESYGWVVRSGEKICGYFPDIIIDGTTLIVEVDGGYHNSKKQKAYDGKRTHHLNKKGYRVLRITNREAKNASLVNARVEAVLGFRCPKFKAKALEPKIVAVIPKAA